MEFCFTGDISDAKFGLTEVLSEIGCTLSDSGYKINLLKSDKKGLKVTFDGDKGEIIYGEKCNLFRAVSLCAKALSEGKTDFSFEEEMQFKTNGTMFDISQGNSVPNIKTAKHFIRQMALMGLNFLMLYCENTFEVKNQPMFGYMRPRYSEEELRLLDDYAYSLGIEMIPCIQTLAHLKDLLRWKCYKKISDYSCCLLVGNEETYKFLEDVISSASRPFRSKRIHIGMDEAFFLGRGKYLDDNGYVESHKIMEQHLKRVLEITDKLGLEAMMWDDMFFTCYGKKRYYQPQNPVPQEVRDSVPKNITCVYWDYARENIDNYRDSIPRHFELTDKVMFAGGIWTWLGYALGWRKTLNSAIAALTACKEKGIKEVFMTTWGDHGTEALMNTNLIGCQLYAELGYSKEFDYDKFKSNFKFMTGGNVEDFEKLEYFDQTPNNPYFDQSCYYNTSKQLMWQDILTGLFDKNIEGVPMNKHYEDLANSLKAAVGNNGQFNDMFEYSKKAAEILSIKSELGNMIRKAYLDKDKVLLSTYADNTLPKLKTMVEQLREFHMKVWFDMYKPIGWDIMDMRYGSLITRINTTIYELKAYINGEFETLEELDFEREYFNCEEGPVRYINDYGKIVSASRIDPTAI